MKKNISISEIEELLNLAPKIEDTRSKEEVFARLKKEGVFAADENQETQQQINQQSIVRKQKVQRQKPKRFIGLLTAAVTFLALSGVFVLTVLQQDNQNADQATGSVEQSQNDSAIEVESTESTKGFTEESAVFAPTAVYEEDLSDYTPFTIGLVTNNIEIVPVTMLIPKERIAQDFEMEPTLLDLYRKYAGEIDEEALGFTEFHPLKGEFKEEESLLTHILPNDHGYDHGTATEFIYQQSLKYTFGYAYNEVELLNEQGEPAELAHIGQVTEPLQIAKYTHQTSYVLQEINGKNYLVPYTAKIYATAEEALVSLKNNFSGNGYFMSPIVKGVDYNVEVQKEVAIVQFKDPLDLNVLNPSEAMHMIEAIRLTVSSYNNSVVFENVVQDNWHGIDFTKALPNPIGMNKMQFPN